jgi:5-methylcytosine-specific restriction protein A
MPKIKTIKPLVGNIKPLVGRAKGEKARDQHRRGNQPWRAWYKTQRWERLRRKAFERDDYTCQRSGEICGGICRDPVNATAVDALIRAAQAYVIVSTALKQAE